MQDAASLQSLPAPFGPLLAASPSSPSPQCTNSQSWDEALSLTGNSKPPLRAHQVTKREAVCSQHRSPIPSISRVPQIPLGSPRPQTTPRYAIPFAGRDSPSEHLVQPSGLERPHSRTVLCPPEHRPAPNRTLAPKPKRKPPILSPDFGDLSPRDAGCFQGVQCLPEPASEPSPQQAPAQGLLLRHPLPLASSPGGHGQGSFARPPSLPQPKESGATGSPWGARRGSWSDPFGPRGSRTSQAAGRGVLLGSRKPGGRASRSPWRPEQSGARGSFAPQPRPGGPRTESTPPAGQWRSPLPALQSCRAGGGGGGLGRFPPTPAREGGAEAPAARVSCPGARPRTVPGPGLAAAGRRLPPGPVAWSGRGRSRRGLVPEGDRSRARSRPPPGPAAARRGPAAPAAPRRPPWDRGKGLGSSRPAWGSRGAARRRLQPGRSCPVSLLTSAILVPLGRTSSAEPSPRMGRLSQSQLPPPPPPPRSARHPPGGGGGSAPYRAGQPSTPPAGSHAHPAPRRAPHSRGRPDGPRCSPALSLSAGVKFLPNWRQARGGWKHWPGRTHVQPVKAPEPAREAENRSDTPVQQGLGAAGRTLGGSTRQTSLSRRLRGGRWRRLIYEKKPC